MFDPLAHWSNIVRSGGQVAEVMAYTDPATIAAPMAARTHTGRPQASTWVTGDANDRKAWNVATNVRVMAPARSPWVDMLSRALNTIRGYFSNRSRDSDGIQLRLVMRCSSPVFRLFLYRCAATGQGLGVAISGRI